MNPVNTYPRAYILGVIDMKTGKFLGADVFSETTPSLGLQHAFVLAEGWGDSFASGLEDLKRQLSTPSFSWIKKILCRRGCDSIGIPEEPVTLRPIYEEIAELERLRIRQALRQTQGNRSAAAKLLGLPLRTLVTRLQSWPDVAIEFPSRVGELGHRRSK